MDAKQCRWGVLSTAKIGMKNWHAINLAENATLTAVASRNIAACRQFVSECQSSVPFEVPPDCVEGYETLLARPDVDAVYVPLPTGIRKEWVIRAADSGKHVLCEKPCAINAAELNEMLSACRRNNVQFMDGVMFMHAERLSEMRSVVDNEIGAIQRVYSQMSFSADDQFRATNIRTNSELEPHGCLGDLGWYNIRIALWAMNWQLPLRVRATHLIQHKRVDGAKGVPMAFSAELYYENGVSAGFYCSFGAHHQQWANISGSKGSVHLTDYVLPFANQKQAFELDQAEFTLDKCQFEMNEQTRVYSSSESPNNAFDSPECKMIRKFSSIVNTRTIDEFWLMVARKTQIVLDACFDSANDGSTIVDVVNL